MVPFNLKVISKFSLCSNCLQKLEKCPLVCGRKIFATAHMLGFSLNFLLYSVSIVCIWETKTDTGKNVSCRANWETLKSFCIKRHIEQGIIGSKLLGMVEP